VDTGALTDSWSALPPVLIARKSGRAVLHKLLGLNRFHGGSAYPSRMIVARQAGGLAGSAAFGMIRQI